MNNYAIAFGMYIVGLSVHVVAVKATVTQTPGVFLDIPRTHGQLSNGWEKETRMRVHACLNLFGIDTGFSISFDPMPPRDASLDLAILAACLGAIGKLPSHWVAFDGDSAFDGLKIFLGSLGIQGEVLPVRGVLPTIVGYCKTRSETDERQFVVPRSNAMEAGHADPQTNVFAIDHVSQLENLHEHIVHRRAYKPVQVKRLPGDPSQFPARVVRAIEISAIGKHRIHFVGSLAFKAARFLCDLLPPMPEEDAIKSACVHSVAGLLTSDQIGVRPFRAPHHVASAQGLAGGGDPIRPGDVSLAHGGVLYLDSLPEFNRGSLEPLSGALRQQVVHIYRRTSSASFPANALLATGCSYCPCGFRNGKHSDFCDDDQRKDWQSRYVATLGIEMVVDADFRDDDKPCSEDIDTLRHWVACAIEFGKQKDLPVPTKNPYGRIARSIANRECRWDVLDVDLERASTLWTGVV